MDEVLRLFFNTMYSYERRCPIQTDATSDSDQILIILRSYKDSAPH